MSYSNIHHPDGREERLRHRIEVVVLEARLKVTEQTLSAVTSDLESIFDRIANDEPVELYYKDGTEISIKADSEPPADDIATHALKMMRARDDETGSLPDAYLKIIDDTLTAIDPLHTRSIREMS